MYVVEGDYISHGRDLLCVELAYYPKSLQDPILGLHPGGTALKASICNGVSAFVKRSTDVSYLFWSLLQYYTIQQHIDMYMCIFINILSRSFKIYTFIYIN